MLLTMLIIIMTSRNEIPASLVINVVVSPERLIYIITKTKGMITIPKFVIA